MAPWRTAMRELWLVGIGTGNPEHVTLEGIRALQNADQILIPRKGADKADLADLRREICDAVLQSPRPEIVEFDLPTRRPDGDYIEAVSDWHDAIAEAWQAASGGGAEKVALLIWGDPSLYDSSLRIAGRLTPAPAIHVVPGITSLQALTAAHSIPINDLARPFTVTTGRLLRENGWPDGATTIAVMLDGGGAFTALDGAAFDIWWGAYLGMPGEMLESGRLGDVAQRILDRRKSARADHGWIMDCYILRRRSR